MGSDSDIASNIGLNVANTITQVSTVTCDFSCTQTQSNNTIIISPGAKAGNITFLQSCIMKDTACAINQSVDSAVESVLSSTVDQSAISSLPLVGLSYSDTKLTSDIGETVTNRISQLVSASCTYETNQTMNDNYVYAGDGATVGDITFSQNSNLSNVECSMDVASKSTSYTEETGDSKQKATTIDMLSMLVLVFGLVIAMAFMLVLVFLLTGGTSAVTAALGNASGGMPAIPGGKGAAAGEGEAAVAGGEAAAVGGEAAGLGSLFAEAEALAPLLI